MTPNPSERTELGLTSTLLHLPLNRQQINERPPPAPQGTIMGMCLIEQRTRKGRNARLRRFWGMAKGGSQQQIIASLVSLSEVRHVKYINKSYEERRAQPMPWLGKGTPCIACKRPAQCRHHIIQVQNGGEVKGGLNIAPLCHACHAKVHPWLISPDGGFIPSNSQRHQQPAPGLTIRADESTGTGSQPAGHSASSNCAGNGAHAPQVNSTTEKTAALRV